MKPENKIFSGQPGEEGGEDGTGVLTQEGVQDEQHVGSQPAFQG